MQVVDSKKRHLGDDELVIDSIALRLEKKLRIQATERLLPLVQISRRKRRSDASETLEPLSSNLKRLKFEEEFQQQRPTRDAPTLAAQQQLAALHTGLTHHLDLITQYDRLARRNSHDASTSSAVVDAPPPGLRSISKKINRNLGAIMAPLDGVIDMIITSSRSDEVNRELKLTAVSNILRVANFSEEERATLTRGFEMWPAQAVRGGATIAAAIHCATQEEDFDRFLNYLRDPIFAAKVKLLDQVIKLRGGARAESILQATRSLEKYLENLADYPIFSSGGEAEIRKVTLHGEERPIPFRRLLATASPTDMEAFESLTIKAIEESSGQTRQDLAVSLFLTAASGWPSLAQKLLNLSDKALLGVNLRSSAVADAAISVAVSNPSAKGPSTVNDKPEESKRSLFTILRLLHALGSESGLDAALLRATEGGNVEAIEALVFLGGEERNILPSITHVIENKRPGLLPALVSGDALSLDAYNEGVRLATETGNGLAISILERAGLRRGFRAVPAYPQAPREVDTIRESDVENKKN